MDGINGFKFAAEVVSGMVNELEQGVFGDAENLITKFLNLSKITGKQIITVAGSPRFGVYGVDFGWGKPKKVDFVSIDRREGRAISLAESRDGSGGIEVGLASNEHEIFKFASLFLDGLRDL